MGFTCFLCKEPFDEANSQGCHKGSGDGQGRSVSATKCGHLFHSDCLKKAFESQSGNAWVTKACPVCPSPLGMQDVFRVRACSVDVASTRNPTVGDLLAMKKQLQKDNSELLKRLEASYLQNRKLHLDQENLKRERDELQLKLEQVLRLNSIHKADVERYMGEVDRYKNIIIHLTAKLTGNPLQEFSVVNQINSCHPSYLDDIQGYSSCDAPSSSMFLNQNGLNGSLQKHPPPGLMHPLSHAMDNHSDSASTNGEQRSIPDEIQHNSISQSMISPDLPKASRDLGLGGFTAAHLQQTSSGLNFGFGRTENRDVRSSNTTNMWHSEENSLIMAMKSSSVSAPKPKENSPQNTRGNGVTMISVPKNEAKPVKLSTQSANNSSKIAEKADSSLHMNDDDDELENTGKWQWHEKKSRRRTTSKGSNSNRTSKGINKGDFTTERKLYGSFECNTCHAKWGSSQSFLNKPQTCRYCQTEVHPYEQGPILSRKQLELVENVKPKK